LACTWDLTADGHLVFTPACGPTPRKLYLDTLGTHLAFRDERVLGDHGPLARVISVPAQPRLIAYVARPCGRVGPVNAPSLRTVRLKRSSTCSGVLGGFVFADGPAKLRLTFRGGNRDHYVAVDGAAHRIPAGASTTVVDMGIGAGQRRFQVSEDWTTSAGAPDLVRADLVEARHSQRVY
jgi:hypothetical protein